MKALDEYKILVKMGKGLNVNTKHPIPEKILPLNDDYAIGWYYRYFSKKSNDYNSPIVEITESQYFALQENPLYVVVIIKWKISGNLVTTYKEDGTVLSKGVVDINRDLIKLEEKTMPGLSLKLPNLKQYWKP